MKNEHEDCEINLTVINDASKICLLYFIVMMSLQKVMHCFSQFIYTKDSNKVLKLKKKKCFKLH